jgi:hypothetical protein
VQIAARIEQLTRQMEAAQQAGDSVNLHWLSQQRRLETLLAGTRDGVTAFARQAQAQVGNAQRAAAALGNQAGAAALQSTLPGGVAWSFGVVPPDALHSLAGALQPGSPTAALFAALPDQAAQAAQSALFTGVALGDGPHTIARALAAATDMTAQRAEVIARTEVLRSYRSAQFANYRANSDVVSQWRWVAHRGPRTCGACLALDGSLHDLDEELDDHPCGACAAEPVTRSWADILGDAGIDGSGIPETSAGASADEGGGASETGAQWFDQQDAATQARILGPAKATAYQAGDLTLADLVDVQHSAQWGSSIREKSLKALGLTASDYRGS